MIEFDRDKLYETLRKNRFNDFYNFDVVKRNIDGFIRKCELEANNQISCLRTDIAERDAKIRVYEDIISKSNFKLAIIDKEGGEDEYN